MDHEYIQERQVVDRYVQGRLPAGEADLFEDHYLTCEECLGRLRLAEQFQSGFRQIAAEDAAGAVGLLAAFLRSRRGLAMGAVLAVLLVVSTMLAVRSMRLGRDLEAARGRLEAEAAKAPLPRAAGAWLVTLVPVRSGPAAREPAQRVALPPVPQWIVLAVDLDLDASGTYRATLERQGGGTVWTGEGLRPSPKGGLAIGLDSALLAPGDHRLRVEQGSFPVARFAFRAEK